MLEDEEARRARKARSKLEDQLWRAERFRLFGGDAVQVDSSLVEGTAGEAREDLQARLAALDGFPSERYAARWGAGGVRRFLTSGGVEVFRLPAETLPRHVNYLYVFEVNGQRVLWDCGSGFGRSRDDVLDGLRITREIFGAPFTADGFDVIIVSHGHIDHFGDVAFFREQNPSSKLWVHELDARVLEHFEERTTLVGRDMRVWLSRSGIAADEASALAELYLGSKSFLAGHTVSVDRRLRHLDEAFGGRGRFHHTPGHCPGHVCLELDDTLFVADQVLNPITPHISPQALHPENGIQRYIHGLVRLRLLDAKQVMPAHYDEIEALGPRIDEIIRDHVVKMEKVREICAKPSTIADVAGVIYGEQKGYNVLLALLEAGAHVEYLHQVGSLVIADLAAVERDEAPSFVATDVFDAPTLADA